MLPNRRSVFGARCGRLCLSFGSATLGLGRLVRPFHPGLSVWVTVHVFVLSFMFGLGGTFTLRAARLSLAHRIGILRPKVQGNGTWPCAEPQRVGLGACIAIISTLLHIRRAAAGPSDTAALRWECQDVPPTHFPSPM